MEIGHAKAAPELAGTDGRRALHLVIAAKRSVAAVEAVLAMDESVAGVTDASGKLLINRQKQIVPKQGTWVIE